MGTGSAVLAIGTVSVVGDWLKTELEKRKGCWLLTTINNKTSSCRLSRNTNDKFQVCDKKSY